MTDPVGGAAREAARRPRHAPTREAGRPGVLQATFIPEESAMAWWGVREPTDLLAETGLPPGRPGVCRFAVPVTDGAAEAIAPREVPVRLADLDGALPALRALDRRHRAETALGASVWAWREAALLAGDDRGEDELGALAARMPTAAHCVLDAEGTAISSAAALLRRFRQMVLTHRELGAAAVRADLRPYQVTGVSWLRTLPENGGGGILADEMGLGKTLQAICLLATRQGPRATGPHLVVCPTSVVGNWARELARFAPAIPVIGHHGPGRGLPDPVPPGTVIITSYSVLRADAATLTEISWDVAVFDEAQQIKNPEALATRTAARIPAGLRVAMTGTPVENRLDELWSILNVTNPGLLGGRARFRQRFGVPIEQRRSATAAKRLGALVAPYVLRRTKSDVAADLPPKQFVTVACSLTGEQARLYRDAVDRAFTDGLGAGAARRGRVLALLTALKQICNHPAQFLGDDAELAGRSGKLDRVAEMLSEIVEDDDRALVFTQYRVMGELLARHLADVLGTPVPFLHGGLDVRRRDALVHAFQSDDDAPPVLLLSLRAAGFGVNLTRAGHVVHYDRWWNPAVEDQATDRAHRIGRRGPLTVHTLVTGGTVEEHIARLHDAKRALAGAVSGDAAAALAELPDERLRAVLALGEEGVL
ncbi:DEAD/DEAH box helicase [Actinoallomurus sp. NPDC050550]|uniref:DEAD/DEAH box helicase n=1 Tax=Actinoallomurus sp. NPDC050550 TaxID=3154937 RepID=UPI0033D94342